MPELLSSPYRSSGSSAIGRNPDGRQAIIFVKSPNESNYEQDEYTRTFAETNLYLPIFLSILKTNIDESQIDQLKTILQRGPTDLGLSGVVITSSRSVDSIQHALNKIQHELHKKKPEEDRADANHFQQPVGKETKGSSWSSIPFFVVGTSTRKRLMNLNNFSNSKIFPNPKNGEIQILGHHQSGSGFRLAEFIKSHFDVSEKNDHQQTRQWHGQIDNYRPSAKGAGAKETTINLLYLTGDPRDSGLSENLVNHNKESKSEMKFNLIEKIVYSIKPETEPGFEPKDLFNLDSSVESNHRIEEEEQNRLEKEIRVELDEIQKQQQQHQPSTENQRLLNWIIFFSPNSSRIFLNNINNLLVKTKSRFQNLKHQDIDNRFQLESSNMKDKEWNRFKFYENLLNLNLIKVGAIGPTTSNFIMNNFKFSPHVVSLKPNPSSLIKAILDYDHHSNS